MNHLSARNGEQLVQPMYYEYPTLGGYPGVAYTKPNQFLFGTQLMIAPIVSPVSSVTGLSSVEAWFPPGSRYVDIFSSAVYDGDCRIKLHRPLDGYPVLAKEGAIIPLDGDIVPANACGNPDTIELIVVVGADGKFTLIEDDGVGSTVEEVVSTETPITFTQESGTLNIGPASQSGPDRTWKVRFVAYGKAPLSVTVDGKSIDVESSCVVFDTTTTIHLPSCAKAVITLGENPQLTPTDVKKFVFPILDHAQVDYNEKSVLWEALLRAGSKTTKVSRVMAANLSEDVRHAVLEYVLADERSTW